MGLIGRGGISRECHTSTWLGRISRWILVYSGLAGSSGRNGAQPDDTGGLGGTIIMCTMNRPFICGNYGPDITLDHGFTDMGSQDRIISS